MTKQVDEIIEPEPDAWMLDMPIGLQYFCYPTSPFPPPPKKIFASQFPQNIWLPLPLNDFASSKNLVAVSAISSPLTTTKYQYSGMVTFWW